MSRIEIQESLSRSAQAHSGAVALVASADASASIAEALADGGYQAVLFDSAQELIEDCAVDPLHPGHETVVLWSGEKLASASPSIERIAKSLPGSAIVVVYATMRRWELRNALTAGACGLVELDRLDATLAATVQAARAGLVCAPRTNWRQIDPPALSTREKQILSLVVMGYMNSEIAKQLFLAESTVKSHLSSAFGKLGVRSRNEAVNLIVDPEHGLGMGILGLGGERIEMASATG